LGGGVVEVGYDTDVIVAAVFGVEQAFYLITYYFGAR